MDREDLVDSELVSWEVENEDAFTYIVAEYRRMRAMIERAGSAAQALVVLLV